MQSTERVNGILAEPPAEAAPIPQKEKTNSDGTLVFVQIVICLLLLAAVLLMQQITPELFTSLRQDYAWAFDQVALIRDGEVSVLYEE